MEDFETKEYEDSKKIFFIYSQNYHMNKITKLYKSEFLEDIILVKEEKKDKKVYPIYSLILKDKYNKQPITFEIEKDGRKYSTKVEVQDLLSEIFIFKIDFTHKENKKDATKFTLSYNEQFQKFADLKDDNDIPIGLSMQYYKNLCISAINFIASSQDSYFLDFLFIVFIYCYTLHKNNKEDKLIKKLFDAITIKSIEPKDLDLKNKRANIPNNQFFNDSLKLFSKEENKIEELVKYGGKENLEKIHLILSYYYLKYSLKNFIPFATLNDEIFNNLTKNRKLFNDFSSDVINFDLIDDTQNTEQIETLLKYLPNMDELFNVFTSLETFHKVSGLSILENKFMNVLKIKVPKKEDNIEKIYNYFLIINQICQDENVLVFELPNDFFLKYAKFNEKTNLNNLKLIKEMYEIYASLIKPMDKEKIIKELNNNYYSTGIHLIDKGYNNLKNEKVIEFLQESENSNIKLDPELFANMIDLGSASEDFKNDFLNNDFKKFDLKEAFGKEFEIFIQKIFKQFVNQSQLLKLKNWKISPNVDKEVLKVCLRRVKLVLKNEANKAEENNKKVKLYTDLFDFFCNLFSISSRKINDYLIDELTELENNFPKGKLLEVYFRILNRGRKIYPISDIFHQHLKNYIQYNSGKGPLSIWYKLVITEPNNRLVYLYKNLKPEHAVKKEDFVGYPKELKETISLFSYLYFAKYFTYNYITELEYYKNSIKAKNELIDLKYIDGMKILKNYNQFFRLFKIFIPIKQYKEDKYVIEFTSFYDKLNSYKIKYDSLKEVYDYWNFFFKKTKKNDIIGLNDLIKSLEKTPLKEFDSKKNEFSVYLNYLEESRNGNKLKKSIFFIGYYNIYKNNFKEEEIKLFNHTNEEFKKLKNLGNSKLADYGKDLESIIINNYKKEKKEEGIINELYFIRNYFGFNKNNNEDKFDIQKFLPEIEEIIDRINPEPAPDSGTVPEIASEPVPEPVPGPIPLNPVLKELEEKFNNYFDYYESYKDYKNSNEEEFYKNYILIFKKIFEKKDEIINLKPIYFAEGILKKMIKVYNYALNMKITNYSGPEKSIYIINQLFEIIEIYKNNNHSLNTISETIIKLLPLISDRIEFEDISKDFITIKEIYDVLKELQNLNENEIANYCINILIQKIEKENITNIKDLGPILDFVIDTFIDECTPLIDKLFSNIFFSNLKKRQFQNISFNHEYTSYLEKKCSKSQPLREKLLFYFENNINKILNEVYGETFIEDRNIRNYIEDSVSFLQKNEGNNNINLLFVIAFLKVFLNNYMKSIENNAGNYKENLREIITKDNELFSYYVLKLYLDLEGNFLDLIHADIKFDFSDDVSGQINEKTKTKKYFGFDYLFLPMNKEQSIIYNDIIKKMLNSLKEQLKSDVGIVEDINKSSIDILFCIFANTFLSRFNDQLFFDKNEYDILFEWFNEKIKNNSFNLLNDKSSIILKTFVNLRNEKKIKFDNNKELISILFALRIALNSLRSQDINSFFYNLLVNTNSTISKYSDIFNFYFNNDNIILQDMESFKIVRFTLLSHLLFAYLLSNIQLGKIKEITNIILEDKNCFKILSEEFKSIIKIIRFKGIKNANSIIYMNIIFETIRNLQYDNIKDEKKLLYLERIDPDYYYDKIKAYFNILNEIRIDENMEMNQFKKIIFEDYNLYNKDIAKYKYLNYLTTPNYCLLDDFVYQYECLTKKYKTIDFILKKDINLDDIINVLNCLPEINSFINKIYNENLLTISKEDAETTSNLNNYDNYNSKLILIKQYLSKFNSTIKINEVNNNTNISEVINIKDNSINKMYESLENIITIYNNFLSDLKNINKDGTDLKPLIIQDFSNDDCFYLKQKENNNENNIAFKRLLELISLYSNRHRYIEKELNVYTGDKINYDFKLIEFQLKKELILGKRPLKNSQRLFIFSNNIFAGERANLLSEFMIKYPQDRTKNDKIESMEEKLNDAESYVVVQIYHNLQYIIIYLMQYYNNNNKEKKISLENIGKIIKASGYIINNLLLSKPSNELYLNNIITLYEIVELISFESLTGTFEDNEQRLKTDYLKDNNEKDKIIEYFGNENLLLDEEIVANAVKRYILRYCLGDYETKNEILKNMKFDKILLRNDIWEEDILKDERFKAEIEQLKQFKSECLEKYFLAKVFNIEIDDEED